MPLPKNTTLEFVKTVGNLFYRTQNHKNIAHKKITYFLNYLRTHYRLDTSHFNEEFRGALGLALGGATHLTQRRRLEAEVATS